SRYYGSVFMGHSRAEDMLEHFNEGIKDLDLNKLLSVSMDEPNVKWEFIELLQDQIQDQCAGAQLEIVVLRALHNIFDGAPARWEDFLAITKLLWSSLPLKSGSTHCFIFTTACLDPLIMAKFHFFLSVSKNFQPFLLKFQNDVPMIPFLGRDLEELIKSLLRRFIKRETLEISSMKLVKLDVTDQNLWVNPKNVDLGMGATAAIKEHVLLGSQRDAQRARICISKMKSLILKMIHRKKLEEEFLLEMKSFSSLRLFSSWRPETVVSYLQL
ncbi:hypothetical protein WMY93_033849, partial [Mugilogobius chulae]